MFSGLLGSSTISSKFLKDIDLAFSSSQFSEDSVFKHLEKKEGAQLPEGNKEGEQLADSYILSYYLNFNKDKGNDKFLTNLLQSSSPYISVLKVRCFSAFSKKFIDEKNEDYVNARKFCRKPQKMEEFLYKDYFQDQNSSELLIEKVKNNIHHLKEGLPDDHAGSDVFIKGYGHRNDHGKMLGVEKSCEEKVSNITTNHPFFDDYGKIGIEYCRRIPEYKAGKKDIKNNKKHGYILGLNVRNY